MKCSSRSAFWVCDGNWQARAIACLRNKTLPFKGSSVLKPMFTVPFYTVSAFSLFRNFVFKIAIKAT